MNTIVITGNLVSKPTKYESEEYTILKFRVANNYYQGKEKDRGTNFIDCTMRGAFAKISYDILDSGSPVTVYGELRTDNYTTKEGEPASKLFINVRDIVLPPKSKDTTDAKN